MQRAKRAAKIAIARVDANPRWRSSGFGDQPSIVPRKKRHSAD
jgi:hypothetical protein